MLLVVLAASRRAVREPVDSLLRAVQARHTGTGAGAAEITMIVFSLTAVVALVTGNLEGPLATLAPTLLAVAVGLLLGRALAPATRAVSRRLLRSGRAVAAAGIVNAVRRPAARRILVMVVVASALFVFCVDALVTGKLNRQNAAEQENGAPYSLAIQAARLTDVVAAVAAADPDHEHLTAVVTSTPTGLARAGGRPSPSTRRRSRAWPTSRGPAQRDDWAAIGAPEVEPVPLTGTTVAGTVDAVEIRFRGPSKRFEDVRSVLQVQDAAGLTHLVPLAVIPRLDRGIPFSVAVPCEDGCVVTGLTMSTPPGLELEGSVFFRDLRLDGAPASLGGPGDYRKIVDDDGTLVPAEDAAGNLGATITTAGGEDAGHVRHVGPRAGAGAGDHGGGPDVHRAGPRGPGEHDGRGHRGPGAGVAAGIATRRRGRAAAASRLRDHRRHRHGVVRRRGRRVRGPEDAPGARRRRQRRHHHRPGAGSPALKLLRRWSSGMTDLSTRVSTYGRGAFQ